MLSVESLVRIEFMTNFIKCGKCIACTKFNGLNGNGYQPCHRPIPPRIPTPLLKIIEGPNITMSPTDYKEKPIWFFIWLIGLFIGISIGLVIAKSL